VVAEGAIASPAAGAGAVGPAPSQAGPGAPAAPPSASEPGPGDRPPREP
jgi:hypothetical protein